MKGEAETGVARGELDGESTPRCSRALSKAVGKPSLTGPRTLLATVASWDTILSMLLSVPGAVEGVEALGVEAVGVELAVAEAAAMATLWACRRLSASFFSLGMPGEEQGVRAWGDPGVVVGLGPSTWLLSSGLGLDEAPLFPLGVL